MSAVKRQIGHPGKEIRIKLVADDSTEKAKQLLEHGGECGSWDVFKALIQLLGKPVNSSRQLPVDEQMTPEQARLCFYREGAAPIEADYVSVWCAVTQEIEIRPDHAPFSGGGTIGGGE